VLRGGRLEDRRHDHERARGLRDATHRPVPHDARLADRELRLAVMLRLLKLVLRLLAVPTARRRPVALSPRPPVPGTERDPPLAVAVRRASATGGASAGGRAPGCRVRS